VQEEVAMGTARRARAASRPAWAITAAVAAALVLAACASSLSPGGPASTPGRSGGSRGGAVVTLTNISTLRTLFNREAGHPRLILIFSPT
jgi:hypothetical protein